MLMSPSPASVLPSCSSKVALPNVITKTKQFQAEKLPDLDTELFMLTQTQLLKHPVKRRRTAIGFWYQWLTFTENGPKYCCKEDKKQNHLLAKNYSVKYPENKASKIK